MIASLRYSINFFSIRIKEETQIAILFLVTMCQRYMVIGNPIHILGKIISQEQIPSWRSDVTSLV